MGPLFCGYCFSRCKRPFMVWLEVVGQNKCTRSPTKKNTHHLPMNAPLPLAFARDRIIFHALILPTPRSRKRRSGSTISEVYSRYNMRIVIIVRRIICFWFDRFPIHLRSDALSCDSGVSGYCVRWSFSKHRQRQPAPVRHKSRSTERKMCAHWPGHL